LTLFHSPGIKTKKMTTSLDIPDNMVSQVQQYLALLELSGPEDTQQPTQAGEIHSSPPGEPGELCEVKGVISHRIRENEFQFLLKFTDKSEEWIPDCDCNCEELIAKYLQTLNISTDYVFCRVSTKEQASSTSLSLNAQAKEICDQLEVTPTNRVKVYRLAQSAYRNIPQQLRIIGEVATKGDTIHIWRVDRLARNLVKYLAWLEDLNSRGIEIHSTSEFLLYSEHKLQFIQSIVDAQKEADILGHRVKLANRRKIERGDQAIGHLKFGLKYDRILDNQGNTIKKIIVPCPKEQDIINYIKKSTKGAQELAQELNQKNLLKRNRKWSVRMIKYILATHHDAQPISRTA
jgi:DNA invertase Pin-like site-specific DNA recombinase